MFGVESRTERYCQQLCSEKCGSGGLCELEESSNEDFSLEEGKEQLG
jgi:hypothetical protein